MYYVITYNPKDTGSKTADQSEWQSFKDYNLAERHYNKVVEYNDPFSITKIIKDKSIEDAKIKFFASLLMEGRDF